MDLWTDLNSGADWGLDLWDQQDGLFGDLNEISHLKGGMDPALKPRVAVEQLPDSPKSENPLDFDWMESGDLGVFLDALDNSQERSLSIQDSSLDCSQEDLKTSVSITDDHTKLLLNNYAVTYNQGLTPPESPEQVTPVIKLDPEINDNLLSLKVQNITSTELSEKIHVSVEDCNIAEPSVIEFQSQDPNFLLDQIDSKTEVYGVSDIFGLTFITSDPETGLGLVETKDDTIGDISCTYSSDDGSSILLSPCESPCPKPSIDSLIQSSPELYKVIATPSDLSTRFSPYPKTKDQKVKGGSKSSKPKVLKHSPEPEPIFEEDYFPSHLGKKERKKLQNKNAAIRYRQKKKAEVECIVGEMQGLEDRNQELKTKVDDLQREVKYMKTLMEDIYRAKGGLVK